MLAMCTISREDGGVPVCYSFGKREDSHHATSLLQTTPRLPTALSQPLFSFIHIIEATTPERSASSQGISRTVVSTGKPASTCSVFEGMQDERVLDLVAEQA